MTEFAERASQASSLSPKKDSMCRCVACWFMPSLPWSNLKPQRDRLRARAFKRRDKFHCLEGDIATRPCFRVFKQLVFARNAVHRGSFCHLLWKIDRPPRSEGFLVTGLANFLTTGGKKPSSPMVQRSNSFARLRAVRAVSTFDA